MKALLLAGGRGERLAPLTDTAPKPLVRVLDVPVIEYALAHLSKLGVREAAVSICYRAEDVRRVLGEVAHGIRLHYLQEETPLGTAGAVRALSDFFDEETVVLSGDALFDFDLEKALSVHREKKACATLVLTEREDVGEYGVVRVGEDLRVRAFSEKPAWSGVFSNLVNCGIYVLSKEAREKISAPPVDFSHDLFPQLLEEGLGLYGVPLSGYWCDIGSPASLYRCNLDALHGKVRLPFPVRGRFVGSGDTRSFLGEGVRLLRGSRAENCVIGARTTLVSSHVTDSVLGRDGTLSFGTRVISSLAADRFTTEKNVTVSASSVLGEGVHLSEGASVDTSSVLSPGEHRAAQDEAFSPIRELFSYSAFSETASPAALREVLYRLGKALSSVFDRLLLCSGEGKEAKSLFETLLCGVADAGKAASFAADTSVYEAIFAARQTSSVTAHLSFDAQASRVRLSLFDSFGFPLPGEDTRRVERAFAKNGVDGTAFFAPRDLTLEVKAAYLSFLSSLLPPLSSVALSSEQHGTLRPLSLALLRAGATLSEDAPLRFSFDEKQTTLFVSDEEGVVCRAEKLRDFLLTTILPRGAVHYAHAPLSERVERELSSRGVRLLSPISVVREERERLCTLALRDAPFYDPLALCAKTLSYLFRNECPLHELRRVLSREPECFEQEREFVFPKQESARLFSRLWDVADTENGLCLSSEKGACHLYPEHGRVRLRAMANSAEAARELCDLTEQQLNVLRNTKEN